MLPRVFQQFVEQRPICVMAQAVLENLFQAKRLDALFERVAQRQYTRRLLFSALMELMVAVVLCAEPSVYAAYRHRRKRLGVSDQAVYDKLDGMELGIAAAVVDDSAQQAAAVIDALGTRRKPWLPGYRVRILDGNHLSSTEHRVAELRTTWAAALPGKVLVVIEPDTGLSTEVFLTPDGHAQERSLLDEVLAQVEKGDLWIADRNFCTLKFLFGIAATKGFFVIRQHGTVKGKLLGKRRLLGLGPTGKIYEQTIELTFEGVTWTLRRITVDLNQATRDGDYVLHILTNLPAKVSALTVAKLYGQRWTIETLFYEVTQTLACEIDTLAYPKAALFVFCLALVVANAVAVIKAALRAAHGEKEADDLSVYYLALEIEQAYDGMMVALPPPRWALFRRMTATQFAAALREIAAHVDTLLYRKSRRGPKKTPPKRGRYKNGGHVSTHKLLTEKPP
jgi:cell division protein FtsL